MSQFLITVKSCYLVYLPPVAHSPGEWLNFALLKKAESLENSDTIRLHWIDGTTDIYHQVRGQIIKEELKKFSQIEDSPPRKPKGDDLDTLTH